MIQFLAAVLVTAMIVVTATASSAAASSAASAAPQAEAAESQSRIVRLALRPAPPLRLDRVALPPPLRAQATAAKKRDSVWNGVLIGAAIGAAGGFAWSRAECGWNDDECAVYTGLVGIPAGIGIGAAVGAVADLLH